jgi:excisionase family DNA binding protein
MRKESPSDKNHVLDADEASAWLKIPKSTLYKLCTEGEIPAAKVGRHWRFHQNSLEEWFLVQTQKNRPRDLDKAVIKEESDNGTVD